MELLLFRFITQTTHASQLLWVSSPCHRCDGLPPLGKALLIRSIPLSNESNKVLNTFTWSEALDNVEELIEFISSINIDGKKRAQLQSIALKSFLKSVPRQKSDKLILKTFPSSLIVLDVPKNTTRPPRWLVALPCAPQNKDKEECEEEPS
jgi:hypothetical protein